MTTVYRMLAGDGDPRHGTSNGYSNLDCRCEMCKAAWAAECRVRRASRRGQLASNDSRHGNSSTYTNHACRCLKCTFAHSKRLRTSGAS